MVVMGLALGVGSADARSLRDALRDAPQLVGVQGGEPFDALADAFADTAARNLPVVSASAGFTYTYNPELEIFERNSDTLGPIFLERPDTIGEKKFNINVSFQYVQFDDYDGDSIQSLHNDNPLLVNVVDGAGNIIGQETIALEYRIGFQNYVTAFSATYGIRDDLDVNISIPIIQTTLDLGVVANGARAHTKGYAFGVGDILLRGKWRLPLSGDLRAAAGLQFRLPSGDFDDFQGTGEFEASPGFFISTVLWDRVEPELNVALDLVPAQFDQGQARYGVGVDVDIVPRVNGSLAFLGRSQFGGSDENTDFLHQTPSGPQQQPLLGANFDRKDFFDLSFGMRVVVWREIMLFANGIYALNDEGLRNGTIIPTVGVEGTF
jgi:hypothetical protein